MPIDITPAPADALCDYDSACPEPELRNFQARLALVRRVHKARIITRAQARLKLHHIKSYLRVQSDKPAETDSVSAATLAPHVPTLSFATPLAQPIEAHKPTLYRRQDSSDEHIPTPPSYTSTDGDISTANQRLSPTDLVQLFGDATGVSLYTSIDRRL